MNNRYFVRSHIFEAKFREIIKYFCIDLTATQIAQATSLNIHTINSILKKIRLRIAKYCENKGLFESGEVELDESYFGARRVRGRKGRGAFGKTVVFGLKKRGGNVYTQVIRNCTKRDWAC